MKLSKFYGLLNQEGQLATLEGVRGALRKIAKDVFIRNLDEDSLPTAVSPNDEVAVQKLVEDRKTASLEEFSQVMESFEGPKIENAVSVVAEISDRMCEVMELIAEKKGTSFWCFGKKRRLNSKIAEADEELTLWEELLYVWGCFKVFNPDAVSTFKTWVNVEATTQVNELSAKTQNLYEF